MSYPKPLSSRYLVILCSVWRFGFMHVEMYKNMLKTINIKTHFANKVLEFWMAQNYIYSSRYHVECVVVGTRKFVIEMWKRVDIITAKNINSPFTNQLETWITQTYSRLVILCSPLWFSFTMCSKCEDLRIGVVATRCINISFTNKPLPSWVIQKPALI